MNTLSREEWEASIREKYPDAVFPEWIIERFAGFMISPMRNLGDGRIATAVTRAIPAEYSEELANRIADIGRNALLYMVYGIRVMDPETFTPKTVRRIRYAVIPQ